MASIEQEARNNLVQAHKDEAAAKALYDEAEKVFQRTERTENAAAGRDRDNKKGAWNRAIDARKAAETRLERAIGR